MSLTNLTLGNGVTHIGDWAIIYCTGLTSLVIPTNVTSIGYEAFSFCSGLTSVTIPRSVSNMGASAFMECPSLKGVYFKGNAPTFGSNLFTYDGDVTAYYLPGTTGWGPTFGDRPTAVWRPQVQTSDISFGTRTNRFGFTIAWASGMVIVVDTCTNLTSHAWAPLQTNTMTADTFYFSDPQWANYSSRFYRLRSP